MSNEMSVTGVHTYPVSLCPLNLGRGGDGPGMQEGAPAAGTGGCFGPNLTHSITALSEPLDPHLWNSALPFILQTPGGMLVCKDDIPG